MSRQPEKTETCLRGIEIQRIGNSAVRRARDENRRKGFRMFIPGTVRYTLNCLTEN